MTPLEMIRVIISAVREGQIKRVDAAGRPGETFTDREFFQQYGLTSFPKADAEGLLIKKGNIIYLVASDDRRYRISLAEGEVALYTDEGDKIHLKRNRIIEIAAGEKVIVNTKEAEINATTSAKVVSPVVELGNGTLRKLIDERLAEKLNNHITEYNAHMHPTAGTGPPSAPTTPGTNFTLTDFATEKTKAS